MPDNFFFNYLYPVFMVGMALFAIYNLWVWWPSLRSKSRLGIAHSLLYFFILTYGLGKSFQWLGVGPDFLRYHLNDLGFVPAWGGFLLNANRKTLTPGRHVVPNRVPIKTFRFGLLMALAAASIFEILTAFGDTNTAQFSYSGSIDWWDVAMYDISFIVMFSVAGWLYLVKVPEPMAVAAQPTPQLLPDVVSTTTTMPAKRDPKATSSRTTPKGTRPNQPKRKRK